MDFPDYFNIHQAPSGNPGFAPILHQQNFQDDSSWYSFNSNTYTLASNPPSSPQYLGGNNAQSPRNVSRIATDGLDMAWTNITPVSPMAGSDIMDINISDMEFGSYDSFSSMQLLPTPSTAASDLSEGFAFPPIPTRSPQAQKETPDLTLTNSFYQTGIPIGPSSPDDFLFENDFPHIPQAFNYANVYSTENPQWPSSTFMPQQPQMNNAPVFTPVPWDSQNAQASDFQMKANSGTVAFELRRGSGYEPHIGRQHYLDTGKVCTKSFGPEPISPGSQSETEGWVVASYAPSSYAASHGSPRSHGTPASHPPSPVQHNTKRHSHIFDSLPGVQKTATKLTRGRQRGLTALEKKQARDVRDAKACWACHISKTKCSPCSPGKPCEQCARLAGKRRFCLFSCFNDPLETLSTFMVPDYLMGHFTKANVEKFVAQNATTWGTESMAVRMTWGYRRLLRAEVVALSLRSNASEMAHQDQSIIHGDKRPILVRKQSPPIGIPLAAMDEMQNVYASYIQDIVQSDLGEYVPVAYTDQESEFAEELLGAVCNYYSAGLATDNESELLRRAIEMHITSTILERSLILDGPSLQTVSSHLHQTYPTDTAPRCAQRQIKLAFFLLQQRRINRVLKDWGAMMWATNASSSSPPKDKEWATAFCVFVILILVMDKTLGAAYYFCEGRIVHDRLDEGRERGLFGNLVRLTQKELFERCKEIFHWKFKTRKGGKEACNPLRDGNDAFVGKIGELDGDVARLVGDLQGLVGGFHDEIRAHKTFRTDVDSEYTDAGRLACIFLDDFLGR